MRTCFRSLLFCNGNNAVFLTRSRFQIEAPEGFSARLTDPALTNPGFADRSTGLLVSIIAFSEIYYTHFSPALQARKKFRGIYSQTDQISSFKLPRSGDHRFFILCNSG